MLGIVVLAVIVALVFAAINFILVKKRDPGNAKMQEIALAIREGSDTFIAHEYKIILSIAVLIALLLFGIVSWYTGVANSDSRECEGL
jgi:K(+)-stimulated pyrophosphate-energized sodium pump